MKFRRLAEAMSLDYETPMVTVSPIGRSANCS